MHAISNSVRLLIVLVIAMVCPMGLVSGQRPVMEKTAADSIVMPKWEPHLMVGTGFMGTSYGDNRLFTTVAPSLKYRPNDRWTISGGFRITSDMGLNPHYMASGSNKSLAPYKRNGGTGLASAHVGAQYRVNENVWVAASVYHLGGTYAPLYGFANGQVLDVSATALSAAAAFRFSNNNFLHLSFTVVRDHNGTLPFLYHDMWMHGGLGSWGMCTSPTDCYRMVSPFSPYYCGGIY